MYVCVCMCVYVCVCGVGVGGNLVQEIHIINSSVMHTIHDTILYNLRHT